VRGRRRKINARTSDVQARKSLDTILIQAGIGPLPGSQGGCYEPAFQGSRLASPASFSYALHSDVSMRCASCIISQDKPCMLRIQAKAG